MQKPQCTHLRITDSDYAMRGSANCSGEKSVCMMSVQIAPRLKYPGRVEGAPHSHLDPGYARVRAHRGDNFLPPTQYTGVGGLASLCSLRFALVQSALDRLQATKYQFQSTGTWRQQPRHHETGDISLQLWNSVRPRGQPRTDGGRVAR